VKYKVGDVVRCNWCVKSHKGVSCITHISMSSDGEFIVRYKSDGIGCNVYQKDLEEPSEKQIAEYLIREIGG